MRAWYENEFQPISALLRLQDALQRAFERPMAPWLAGPSGRGVFPALNVFNEKENFVVRMELPGLSPENIVIDRQGQTLRIEGKREQPSIDEGSLHRRERWAGEFTRSLQLPEDLDLDKTEASYRNGILTVRVPKSEAQKPRQIPVSTS
jgi:HSP20 family protein